MALLTPAPPQWQNATGDNATASLVTTWTMPALPPGSDGQVLMDVQYSDDNQTWNDVRGATGIPNPFGIPYAAQIQVRDYEAPSGQLRTYRARAYTFDNATATSSMTTSWTTMPGRVNIVITDWWLKCPENPSLNVKIDVDWADIDFDAPVDRAIVYVPNRRTPIVDHGIDHAEQIKFTVYAEDTAVQKAIVRLHRTTETLLLQDDLGQQWYVVIDGKMPRKRKPAAGDPDYRIELNLYEVDRP
jgi:hypothetical protein